MKWFKKIIFRNFMINIKKNILLLSIAAIFRSANRRDWEKKNNDNIC